MQSERFDRVLGQPLLVDPSESLASERRDPVVLSSAGAAAVLRNARMRWNLLWVNVRTGSHETRHAAYDTLEQMVTAIERGIAQYGDEFDVKRCFYGTEVDLDINMVVRVGLRAKGAL